MSSPYVGEIRMFAGNFAPVGWAFCNGALIPISENETLFQLIGTTYGGDGQNDFALPNLQSRVPIHIGPGFALGQTGGAESVTLTTSQIPAHGHTPLCKSVVDASASKTPQSNLWAFAANNPYTDGTPSNPMDPGAIGASGGSQPHDNMVPFLVINFILSLFGQFPSQT